MGDVPSLATGFPTQSGIEQLLGRLQAMAEETGDHALESSIVTAQRAAACWQELSQRVAYHEHARDVASSLERHARERLHLILDLVTRFADLPSTTGRPLDAAGEGPGPSPRAGTSGAAGTGDRSADQGAAPGVAVRLLGGFELRVDGRRVDQWRGRRGQALLQFLVAHRRRPVSREALIEALWPEADEYAGRRRLHQAVYALRQTLRDAGASYRHIICANGFYQLDPAVPVWTGVEELDRLVAQARRLEAEGHTGRAFETYQEAERLYRGNLLEDVPLAEWATAERSRLLSAYVELANRLADLYAERGDHASAIRICNRVLTRDSWNEESARRKMRSYATSGNPSLALRAFKSCQDELARELGTAPSPETRALYEEILSGARSTRNEMA
jgi:DNA-binding SARP family transcriptional activator